MNYNFKEIEKKWQRFWDDNSDLKTDYKEFKNKKYCNKTCTDKDWVEKNPEKASGIAQSDGERTKPNRLGGGGNGYRRACGAGDYSQPKGGRRGRNH